MTDSRSKFEAWYYKREGTIAKPATDPIAAAAWEGWQAAEAETARRCVDAIQKYLDYHNTACAHYTPKDHPAFSYHLTRVAIASDIKQAIKAEFPEAFK